MFQQDRAEYRRVSISADDGRLALVIDGVVQSVEVGPDGCGPGYWTAMLPDIRPDSALILGLGGGTIVQLLNRHFGSVPIVGVESDPLVIEAAHNILGLGLENLQVVHDDAFAFVASCRDHYDYVCVDLFSGGQLARGVVGKSFISGVDRLLTPRGIAVFNLFLSRRLPRQLTRLSHRFQVVKALDVEMNVVVHCRRK